MGEHRRLGLIEDGALRSSWNEANQLPRGVT